jgi:hypothetical protein
MRPTPNLLSGGNSGSDLSPSSNRRMRSRMYGGVGAGRGNPPGYPIMPGMPTNLWGASPLYENETPAERQYTKCNAEGNKY